jgi:Ca2+-binding RTX toxin-like protein
MSPLRRPSVRLVLAAGTAGLLMGAAPALGQELAVPSAGVAFAPDGSETQHRNSNVLLDVITCEGGRCEGTEEADTIVANNATQRVIAFGGDDDIELDAIFTSGSGDVGIGGEGRDCIDGGAGNDLMIGGPGDDNRPCEFTAFVDPQAGLTGGPGDDRIDGGPGNDSLNGIFDDDTLLGGTGDDLLRDTSVADKDRLFGGPGKDTLDATDGDGDDLVDGGTGDDDCSGDSADRFVNCERITRL